MKINLSESYDFNISVDESTTELFTMDGIYLYQIISCYYNTIKNDRTGYVKFKNGAMVNNEYFKKIIEYERTPCDDIRQRLKDINILVEQIKVKSHL